MATKAPPEKGQKTTRQTGKELCIKGKISKGREQDRDNEIGGRKDGKNSNKDGKALHGLVACLANHPVPFNLVNSRRRKTAIFTTKLRKLEEETQKHFPINLLNRHENTSHQKKIPKERKARKRLKLQSFSPYCTLHSNKKGLRSSSRPSSPLAPDPPRELDVLGHDGDPLRVDGAQVGVLKKPHQIGLRRLLQCRDGAALEPEVRLEVLRDLPHQPLERQLPDQQLRALLVLAYLPQRHRPGPEAMRLLDPAGRRGRLPRRLGGELLPRGLAAGGLPRRLLGSRHFSGASAAIEREV
ncbi:hypothetical protein EUGRSUZ_H04911 [Eucalyptus grandis]|uniref:Uncharacterized protein n=2 Tax=Eucalyptus grandis TaxID=71139 RepID=A0ACC3JYY4_EUCGR|nr:hypothetical protein EUGRSUZ_H04911 [Eucalyptus grandis]